MSKFRVKVESVDDETLFTHKEIRVEGKRVETPAKSISIQKSTKKDRISSEARGFNEIYFQVTPEGLYEAQNSYDSPLRKKLTKALNKTNSDEINLIFANFQSTKEMMRDNLEYLHDLLYSTSDFVTIPLMPELLSAIKDDGRGTASIHFDTYMNNIHNFVEISRQLGNKPVMGVIPSLPRAFINRIIDFYMNEGIHAYAFNFNGRTVTAEQQLTDMVAPLMRNIAMEDRQEDVLLYALNAHRGRSSDEGDYIPARDFMSFGFGMDILGDKHTGGNLPPHLLEKMKNSDPTFRLFDRRAYFYQNHEYDQLAHFLPDQTGLNKRRILDNPSYGYRLATLLNGEQQALEAKNLQLYIDEDRVTESIERRVGVKNEDVRSMQDTKRKFDSQQDQKTLSDLDDMLG